MSLVLVHVHGHAHVPSDGTSVGRRLALQAMQIRNEGIKVCDFDANVCAPQPNCKLQGYRLHQWTSLRKVVDAECAMSIGGPATSGATGKVSQREPQVHDCDAFVNDEVSSTFSAGSSVAARGGFVHVGGSNVTKRFNGSSFMYQNVFRLTRGMCGWEEYLFERLALCRLARFSSPCGSKDGQGRRRTHFFPRLLAWDDATLTLVMTNEGHALMSGMLPGATLHKTEELSGVIRTRSRQAGAPETLGDLNVHCTRVMDTQKCSDQQTSLRRRREHSNVSFYQEQLTCMEEQLLRSNITHGDIACKNLFVRTKGRLTMGDLNSCLVDGMPGLNIYGHALLRKRAQWGSK